MKICNLILLNFCFFLPSMLFGMDSRTEKRREVVSIIDRDMPLMLRNVGDIATHPGIEFQVLNDSGHVLQFTNAREQYIFLHAAFIKLLNEHSALENKISQHLNDVQRNENNPGYTGDDDARIINLRALLMSNEEHQETLLGDIKKIELYVFDEFHKRSTGNEDAGKSGHGQHGQGQHGHGQDGQGHRGQGHSGGHRASGSGN